MKMKKRFLSMLLVLSMCITMVLPLPVSAAEAVNDGEPLVSEWAVNDLIYGQNYGLFSQKWIEDGLTGQISHARFRTLLAKLRHKILDTDYAVQARSENPRLTHDVTVEDAVKALYT